MTAIVCPEPPELARLALGELSEAEAENLGQHILSCSSCAQLLHSLQAADPFVKDLRAFGELLPAVPGVEALVERFLQARIGSAHETTGAATTDETPGGSDDHAPLPQQVGHYQVLGRLGAGGMGVVYQARHLTLNRIVALKMILHGPHADAADLARFRAEALAVARLQHANIVQIHEIGEHNGLPYLALEFCSGGSLDMKLGGTPMLPREAAQMVQTLAQAMHYAHAQHIIHRDLKPANVLLAGDGTPKITDFGLAKNQDVEGLTHSNAVVGTPQYMAPEQAEGKSREIGPAVDIYALGAVLFHMLTGRPPFRGKNTVDILMQVIGEKPPELSRLQPKTPRDLENICARCLQKDRHKRYASAGALAADLGRFLKGEPVEARATPRLEQAVMWMRRYPARASVLGMGVLLMLVLAIGNVIAVFWRQAEVAKNELAQINGELTLTQKQLERSYDDLNAANKVIKRLAYDDQMGFVGRLAQAGDVAQAKNQLDACDPDNRNLEWYQMQNRLEPDTINLTGHTTPVSSMVFSPDGQQLASYDAAGVGMLWNLKTGQKVTSLHGLPIRGVAFSPDGQWLASAGGDFKNVGEIKLLNAQTGRIVETWVGHKGPISDLAFGPNGKIATAGADSTAKLWYPGARKEIATLGGHRGPVQRVAFSPDGQWLASTGADKTIRLWNATTGAALTTLEGHKAAVTQLAWSPDSKHLASASIDWALKLWDVAAGKERASLKGHQNNVTRLAFSPDGRRLASASEDKVVKLWDVGTGSETKSLPPLLTAVLHIAFSPDGRQLMTACQDGTVKFWDPVKGLESATLAPFQTGATCVALSQGGQRLASAGADKAIYLCNLNSAKHVAAFPGQKGEVRCVSYSADGRTLASATSALVMLWDTFLGKQLARMPGHKDTITQLAFSPNRRVLASASEDKTIRLWDAVTGDPLNTLAGHLHMVSAVVFNPNGQLLASAGWDGTVKLWNASTGAPIATLRGHQGTVSHVAFSPDGQLLASAGWDNTVRIWDVATQQEIATLRGHALNVTHVAFSPDGLQLASASWDKTIILWDRRELRKIATLTGHTGHVLQVVFSPKHDRALASASMDGTVKLWNTERRQQLATLLGHSAEVDHIAFSPDGERLASAGRDGTVILWDAETYKDLISLSDPAKAPVRHLAFRPDGQQLATASADGIVRLWYGKMAEGEWEQRKQGMGN